jgi:hypothetical protein
VAKENRERMTQGLGWFSVGLGLAELLAPRTVSRLIGAPYKPALIPALGLREIATGIRLARWPSGAPASLALLASRGLFRAFAAQFRRFTLAQ